VVLPIVVAVVRALVHGWFPIGDAALLAIRAYDVGTSHNPLLGSWTSASFALGIDVNNPGPLYPDLLAPFMWDVRSGVRNRHRDRDRRGDDQCRQPRSARPWSGRASGVGAPSAGCCCWWRR
jgi:hypothetical protein